MNKQFGSKWGKILKKFAGFLPENMFGDILSILRPHSDCCETCWIGALKRISARAIKKNILSGHGTWSYLADLKVLGGYDCEPNRADIYEEMINEISDADGRKLIWTKRMEAKVDAAVADIGFRMPSDQVTFRQFMEFRDAWTGSGASTEGTPAVVVMKDPNSKPPTKELYTESEVSDKKMWKRRKLRGKFASNLGRTADELVESALEKAPMLLFPFLKTDEPARSRGIVSTDSRSFRRCSYVTKVMIADYNGKSLWTSLGLSPSRRLESREKMAAWNVKPDVWAVSLDQSKFDMSQRKEAVRYAIAAVFKGAIAAVRPDLAEQLEEIRDAELYAFDNAVATFNKGKEDQKTVPWKRGVPSGHAWTGLVDTLLNRAEAEVIAEDLGAEIIDARYQGDDAVLFVHNAPTGEDWAEGYAAYGLMVNAEKTWVSNERFDYLHEIHGPAGVWGFPSRMMKTILWKKPEQGASGFKPKHTWDREYFTALLKAHRRGLANCRDCAQHLLYRRLLPMTEGGTNRVRTRRAGRRAWEAVDTPLAYGGLGFGLSGRVGIRIVVSGMEEAKARIRIVSKLADNSMAWRNVVRARFVSKYPMPNIETAYYHHRIPRSAIRAARMPNILPSHTRVARLQWVFGDYSHEPEAWRKKVQLEAALYDHEIKITKNMLPDARVADSKLGPDRAARLLHKEQGLAMDLSTSSTTGETFAAISIQAKSMWDLSLNLKLRASPLNLSKTLLLIARWAISRVTEFGRGVRVAV